MWDIVKSIAEWPLWGFLSVVLIVYVTQRVIASRERRKKINEVQLDVYLSTIEPLADFYLYALEPSDDIDVAVLHRKFFEIMSRLSIMGTEDVMEAFGRYSDFVFQHVAEKTPADEKQLRRLASDVTYAMCCDIHDEPYKPNSGHITSRST